MSGITTLIIIAAAMACTLGGVSLLAYVYNLNHIKSKTVGDGQHGTARWASSGEIKKTYRHIPYTPKKWREQARKGQTPTMSRLIKKLFGKKGEVVEEALPQGIVTENAEEKKLDVVITKSADDESHIQSLVIVKSTDGGETWVEIDKDDYGTPVTTDTLAYSFRTSAIYKVSVTDEFRTGIDTITAQLDYVQKNPEGTLVGVDNNGYTNGTVTFDWTDEATVVLTKDGVVVPYESGDELTEDGAYTLTFENYDGYKATYAFTIDTKAPEIKTDGADHRESVNEDVKVFYTEENLTAELFKDGKSLGEYTSGNPVSADGQYRIRVSDQANNVVEVEFTIDKTVDYAINVNDKPFSAHRCKILLSKFAHSPTKNHRKGEQQ